MFKIGTFCYWMSRQTSLLYVNLGSMVSHLLRNPFVVCFVVLNFLPQETLSQGLDKLLLLDSENWVEIFQGHQPLLYS